MTVTESRRAHTPAGTSFTRTVTVTPDLAKEWLKHNTHNRPMTEVKVDQYAGAMKRGEWMDNGEAIARFAADGTLLDGQKRLAAIIKSGVTIKGFIVDGLDPVAQRTMDIGQARTFSQELNLDGFVNPNQLAALALAVYQWETDTWLSRKPMPTRVQLHNVVELNHDKMQDAIRANHRLQNRLRVTPTSAALAYWLFSHVDQADADDFFDRLTNGTVEASHPIGLLREKLITWMRDTHNRPSRTAVLAHFIKAWNFYRRGETPQYLVFRPGGMNPEKYPQPV